MRRFAVWIVAVGVLACLSVDSSHGLLEMIEPFYPDISLQRVDSIPPSRPVLALRKVWRGYGDTQLPGGMSTSTEDAEMGSITFTMSFADAKTQPRGRFGYNFHFVDGQLPAGLEFSENACATAMRGDSAYPYVGWLDGSSWKQDAFSFRVYATAVDSAGNESLPSNVVAVSDDGNQEERKTVAYEQYYLGFSSDEQQIPTWTGSDEKGAFASLKSSWSGYDIELKTSSGITKGQLQLLVGSAAGKPHRINIYIDAHTKQLGIYEMHGDSLRLCLAPPGANRPSKFHQSGATRLYTLRKTAP